MTRPRAILGALIVIGVGALAYALADQVRDHILLPLAYDVWVVKQLYHAVPQAFIWVVLVTVLIYLPISIILNASVQNDDAHKKSAPAGAVESLRVAIAQRDRGIYFKWRLGNLLATVAINILKYQERRVPGRKLAGRDWNPPPQVEAFIDAGLNTTFADYPAPRGFQPPPVTPFDIDLEPVVAFLESELELDQEK